MTTSNKEMEQLKKEYKEIKMNEEQKKELMKMMEQAKKEKRRKNNNYKGILAAAAVAAFIILPNTSAGVAQAMGSIPVLGKLVQVVTFRDYEYEDEHNVADVEIPEILVDDTANAGNVSEESKENLQGTTKEINGEIRGIADKFVKEFEENLKNEEGYQDVIVKSEITQTTDEYFTIKLICYQGAGSGAEWNYYYTIDLKTGERLALKSLFTEGSDYKAVISENIKEQMQEQMDADENVSYWLNDEMEEWNFRSITDETAFYLNENNEIVISFNEGDVAPMYMGVVQFTIPNEVVEGIRK